MNRDRAAGLALIAAGTLTVMVASRYERGTLQHIGPGWFPAVIAIALIGLGTILSARSRRAAGLTAVRSDPTERSLARPMAIIGALAVFALLIERAGFLVAAPMVVVVAALSERQPQMRSVVIRAVLLTLLAAVIFVVALGLPLDLWPVSVSRR